MFITVYSLRCALYILKHWHENEFTVWIFLKSLFCMVVDNKYFYIFKTFIKAVQHIHYLFLLSRFVLSDKHVCVCAKKISLTPIKMHIKCLKNQTSDLPPLLLIGPKTFNNHDEQMFSQGSPRALSTYWDLILTQTLNETHAYNP